jgi:hypothetical protein
MIRKALFDGFKIFPIKKLELHDFWKIKSRFLDKKNRFQANSPRCDLKALQLHIHVGFDSKLLNPGRRFIFNKTLKIGSKYGF